MAKRLLLLRHGQALHNVRAEAAREGGCSYDAFLQIMKEDDVLDADLTEIGRQQARAVAAARAGVDEPELVVASCLSRALETAALAFPRTTVAPGRFVCIEALREINGYLINGQRRPRTELATRFATCDFSRLSDEHDTQVHDPRPHALPDGRSSYLSVATRPRHAVDGRSRVQRVGRRARVRRPDRPRTPARDIYRRRRAWRTLPSPPQQAPEGAKIPSTPHARAAAQ